MGDDCLKKSDLRKYVCKRKQNDPEFAENYSEGYDELFKKVSDLARQICELKELKKELRKCS